MMGQLAVRLAGSSREPIRIVFGTQSATDRKARRGYQFERQARRIFPNSSSPTILIGPSRPIGAEGKDADAIQPRAKGRELRRAKDTRGFVADPQQNGLKRAPARGRFWGVMDHTQLELFADRSPTPWASNLAALRRLVPENMSDAALIAALPDALLADACALAAEAGRRRLGDAVTALVALCNRFVGFGVDCSVPEQVAALEALGAIGGPEASRSVSQMIVKGIVQGPNLAAAATAASRLRVVLPPDVALPLLRHANPSVRAAACACVRAGGDIVATLIELLADLNGEVATAAACVPASEQLQGNR